MGKPHKSLRELDAELSRRLDETLDEETKFEIEAMDVLETLETPDETLGTPEEAKGSRSSPPEVATAEERQEYTTGPTGETTAAPTAEDDRPRAEVLARVVFEDGDAFHFLAIPADGEIGLAHIGSNERRWIAATSELLSPLRLYVSIAPPDAPLPWLLAAVDKQKDRLALVGERRLCDRVDEPLEAQSGPHGTLQLRVPALPGGVWIPDDYAIGGYCGWNGQKEWFVDWCGGSPEGEHPPGPALEPNIYQCTSELSTEVTHKSIRNGKWRRRKCSEGWAVPCASPVRIRHEYRKVKLFPFPHYEWVQAREDDFDPQPAAAAEGTPWLGIVRRRRKIIYTRQDGIGGFRAWSKFSRHL